MADNDYDFDSPSVAPESAPRKRATKINPAEVTSGWGAPRSYGGHTGDDLGWKHGEPVGIPRPGRVRFAGETKGYGNRVEVEHDDGTVTTYSHLSGVDVRKDDDLDEGSLVGRVGNTGHSRGDHLHFEVLKQGRKVNPLTTDFAPVRGATEVKRRAGRDYDFDAPSYDFEASDSTPSSPPAGNSALPPGSIETTNASPAAAAPTVRTPGSRPTTDEELPLVRSGVSGRKDTPVVSWGGPEVNEWDVRSETERPLDFDAIRRKRAHEREIVGPDPTGRKSHVLRAMNDVPEHLIEEGHPTGRKDLAPRASAPGAARTGGSPERWAQSPASEVDAQAEDLAESAMREAAGSRKENRAARRVVESNLPADLPERMAPGVISDDSRVTRGEKPNTFRVEDEAVQARRRAQERRTAVLRRRVGRTRREHAELVKQAEAMNRAQAEEANAPALSVGELRRQDNSVIEELNRKITSKGELIRRDEERIRAAEAAARNAPSGLGEVRAADETLVPAVERARARAEQEVDAEQERAATYGANRAPAAYATPEERERLVGERTEEHLGDIAARRAVQQTSVDRDALREHYRRQLEGYWSLAPDEMPLRPEERERAIDEMAADALKDLEFAKRATNPDEAIGVLGTLKQRFRDNPGILIPVASSLYDAFGSFGALAAKTRVDEGEGTEADRITLAKHQAWQHANQSFWAGVADNLIQQPAFWGEFALTGGAAEGIETGVEQGLKAGARILIKGGPSRFLSARAAGKIAENRALQTVGEIASKTAATVASGAMRTATVGAPRVAADFANNRVRGEDGPTAFAHAVLNQAGEYISESQGEVLDLAPGVKKLQDAMRPMFKRLERAGYNGVAGEMFEERWKDLYDVATALDADERRQRWEQVKQKWADPSMWAQEAVAFSVPGVANVAAGKLLDAAARGGQKTVNAPAAGGQDVVGEPAPAAQNPASSEVENQATPAAEGTTAESIPAEGTAEVPKDQLAAVRAGSAAVTVVPAGTKLPPDVRSFKDFDGGRVVYNPDLVEREQVVAAMDAGDLEALNNGQPATGEGAGGGLVPQRGQDVVRGAEAEAGRAEPARPVAVDEHGASRLPDGSDPRGAAADGGAARSLNETPAQGSAPVTGFTTAQGSTYTVEGRRTQRTKSKHAGHDPGDVGLKEQSARTVYVTPEDATKIGMHNSLNRESKPRVSLTADGIVLTRKHGKGPNGETYYHEAREVIPFTDEPEVGRAPVEFWKGGKNHPGNPITELQRANAQEPAHHSATQPRDDEGRFRIPEPEEAKSLAKSLRARLEGASDGQEAKTAPGQTDSAPEIGDSYRDAKGRILEVRKSDANEIVQGDAEVVLSPESFKERFERTKHKFSSTQVDVPAAEARAVRDLGASLIPDGALYTDPADDSYGREEHPHITVKYGLHTEQADDVRRALDGTAPFDVTLGETSLFEAKGETPFDVVKVGVESPELHALNAKIAAALKVTETHPTYVPHVTLAYVKRGEGKKYAGDKSFAGKKLRFDAVTFSSSTGETVSMPLKGEKVQGEKSARLTTETQKRDSEQKPDESTPELKPARKSDREVAERIRARLDAEQSEQPTAAEAKASVKKEKVSKRTGLTPTQAEWLAGELEDVADAAIEEQTGTDDAGNKLTGPEFRQRFAKEGGISTSGTYAPDLKLPEPVTIKVPGDGEFTVASAQAANRLHQKVTGRPIEGFERAQNTGVPNGTPKPRGNGEANTDVDAVVEAYGGAQKAHDALQNIWRQLKADPEAAEQMGADWQQMSRTERLIAELKELARRDIKVGDTVEWTDVRGETVRSKVTAVEANGYRVKPYTFKVVRGKKQTSDFVSKSRDVEKVEAEPEASPEEPQSVPEASAREIEHWQGILESDKKNGAERLRNRLAMLITARDFGEPVDSYLEREGLKEFYEWAKPIARGESQPDPAALAETAPGGNAGGSAVTVSFIPTPEEAAVLKRQIVRQLKSLLSGNTLASGLYPAHVVAELMPDIARLGAYHIKQGATTLKAFSGRMVDDVGEGITPHLRKIYSEAKKLVEGEHEEAANSQAGIRDDTQGDRSTGVRAISGKDGEDAGRDSGIHLSADSAATSQPSGAGDISEHGDEEASKNSSGRRERSFPQTLEAAGLEGGDDRTEEPTSPKNAVTERERTERGLAPVEKQAYQAVGAAYLAGREAVTSGAVEPRRLAEAVARSPRPLTAQEVGSLAFDRARLKNEYSKAVAGVARAVEAGDERAVAEGRARLEAIEHDFDLNDQALQKGGREQSAAFNARKMLVLADYSLAAVVNRAKAKKGADIDEETRAKLEELTSKLEYAEERLANARQTIQGLEAERVVKHLNREARRERRQVKREELDHEFDELSTMFGKLASRPHMAAFALDPEMVKIVGRMAKNRVRAGVNTLEGLVDSIHEALAGHFDDLDKRDVRDWISGYGVTSERSQSEAGKTLGELKRQMRLVSALEDAEAGEHPAKSGPAREPESAEVKELRRQVRVVMREHGLAATDSLKAVKTRLQNQIGALERKIAAEDYTKEAKRPPVEYDEEAKKLKAERDRLKMRIEREIARQERTGLLDTATNYRRANLLTAARTHLRNVSSNLIFQTTEEAARPMAALGDLLASRRTGQRTTFGMDIPAAARATVSAAVTEGPRRAADYILGREVVPLEGLENAGAETQAQKAQLEASNTGFRLLDLYVNTVFNTLQAEDALFKVYAFRRELSDIARAQATAEHRADASVSVKGRARELRANPTDAMLVEAAAYADYATFQNPNKVSAAIAGGKRLLGPAGKFLIEQIAPFDRTPTNIILRALENSPVGLVSAALKYRRIGRADAAQALADAALTRAQQKDFARTFGRATTGTALAALAMALAAAGLLSGAIDYDDDRDEYLEKKRAFGGGGMLRVPGTRLRVYIGDTPVGKAMATAAAMWEAMRKPAADEQAGGVLRAGLRVALDQPLVKGLKDVSETESVAEALGAYARSYVPASAFMEHAGEVLDPQQRKFFYGKDDKASFDEKFGAQIRKAIPPGVPGGRDGLPVNPNADAGERGGVGRRLLREFDPFNTTTEREVVRMSGKAAEAFEEAEKNPYRPKDELAIAGKKRQLSADVKQRLERDVRLLTDERVREFLNPPAGEKGRAKRRLLDLYETGTEEYRKGVLTQIQKEASAEVRKKFYEEWGRSNADLIKKEREEDRHNRQAQKEELQRRRLERGDAPKNQRAVISPEEARRAVERLRGGANTPR